jgi:hypothetical protein
MPFSDQSFLYFFPIFFAGFWLLITTVLGAMSGWFELQRHYPTGDEPALLTLRGRSGSMGWGVGLNGILTLGACPAGLRVGIWRIFGPFLRPFLVPWNEIHPIHTTRFFMPSVRLNFGNPAIGALRINARMWQRLAQTSNEAPATSSPYVTRAQAGCGFFLQWATLTMIAGCFFYFTSHAGPQHPGLPPQVSFGFPAIVIGLALGLEFLREG